MTNEYKRTLCDIEIILNELEESEKNKIPSKLRAIISANKLENYESTIKTDIPIEQQKLHPDTQAFLAMLYLNYWCKDEEEKKELKILLKDNEEKYEKELSEKYDVYAKFKEKQEKNNENKMQECNETQITIYRESIIKKILKKIFSFFRRK